MKFIALIAILIGTLANAQEVQHPANPVMMPAIQKTAVIDGVKYYIRKDQNNKFVFIKYTSQENDYAVKPIIVIPTILENNQK